MDLLQIHAYFMAKKPSSVLAHLYFLTFCSTIKLNPYLPLEFLNFFIILVCLLFIHAKHS